MMKRDFEFIASVLADAESRIESDADCSLYTDAQTSYASEILDSVIANLTKQIEKTHPRFKPGIFEIACRPIRNHRLKQEILRKLG